MSEIAYIGYTATEQVLHVETKSGSRYRCYGVDEDTHQRFLESMSRDIFFRDCILESFEFEENYQSPAQVYEGVEKYSLDEF